jgi:aspartyl aminopeptidase
MKPDKKTHALNLIDFIHACPSPFHVVNVIEKRLLSHGYHELKPENKWQIATGGKYFVKRNQSSIFAFQMGTEAPEKHGFKLISTHSDSPGFKVKPMPEMVSDNHFLKLNTEVYGGPILMTWLDRPLSLAGRVITKGHNRLNPAQHLVDFKRPLMVIPNLAIHLNRSVNEGVELNKQIDMLPLLGIINSTFEKNDYLRQLISKETGIDSSEILDFELFLAEYDKGVLTGVNEEFISSSRLDDLAMVHAGLEALLNCGPSAATQILCVFDNEEVGSVSKQGAGAPFLKHIIERVLAVQGKGVEELHQSIYQSFMISADMAHSTHPNRPEKHDPVLHPLINKGPVIKIHAGQKYTTDGDSGAVFASLCRDHKIPFQQFANRSDAQGGSTLGNISTTQLDIRTVDVGSPMLGMHSMRELAGVDDHYWMTQAFEAFYKE